MHIVKLSKGADTAVFDLAAVIKAKTDGILGVLGLTTVFGKKLNPSA